MEWEGLFCFFEHSEAGHTLVIGDKPSVHEPLPGAAALPLRDRDERSADGEYLYQLERVHRLRPGAVHLKDYDFEKPTLDVSGKAKSSQGKPALEIYDYPGEYVAPGVGKQAAKVRMEEGVQAARTLSKRFNPKVGTLRSWNHHREQWAYPVIIDNMMNLELLFAATRLSGDSTFYKIAVSHATTTLHNHFRPDFSSYHVVDYDTLTGQVIKKTTHQGYANESAWARGQAWALYGFTMCYRETRNPAFLAHKRGFHDIARQHYRRD